MSIEAQNLVAQKPELQANLGGTLRMVGPGGADHLDTASAYYATSGQILRGLARQLFAYPAAKDLSDIERCFTPQPDIAIEIPTRENGGISKDRKIYTIRLRSGVLWDTTPPREVTAQDFIRGLKRLGNPVAGAGARHYFTSTILGMKEYCDAYDQAFLGRVPRAPDLAAFQNSHQIEGLDAPDDKTLVIKLMQPANDFLNIMAMGFASPAPAEYDAYLPDSLDFRRNFISNGPYKIASYATDATEIVLERNPVWEQQSDPIRHQRVDTIHIRVAKERPETMMRKISAGEIDLAWSYTVVSWAKPPADWGDYPRSYPGYALNPYLVFNMESPNAGGALRNLKVRQAIAYAIDKVAISRILSVLEGVPNEPLHSVIPPGSVGHREFNLYPTSNDRGDITKARKLMAESGFDGELTLIAAVREAALHQNVMKSVAADLEKIGIKLVVNLYSQAEYYGSLLSDPAKAKAGVWDIAEPGWTPDWFGNNGRAIVQPLFQTNATAGTTNYGCYSNSAVDELIAKALQEADADKAEQLWHEVDEQVMKDVPVIPILAFAAMSSRFHSPRVKNVAHVPQIEFFDITHLSLDPIDTS